VAQPGTAQPWKTNPARLFPHGFPGSNPGGGVFFLQARPYLKIQLLRNCPPNKFGVRAAAFLS